ncbi:MAG: hypothetical protein ACOVNZ_06430 [Crocinitomicaceae bacterium]
MKELVSNIQSLLNKLEEGNITREEMEQMVVDARELNERLIVLRYKVYEQGIFEELPSASEPEELPEIELDLVFTEESTEENEESQPEIDSIVELTEDSIEETSEPHSENENISEQDDEIEIGLFSAEEEFESPNNQPTESEEGLDALENEELVSEHTSFSTHYDEESKTETEEITHEETSIIESEDSTMIIEHVETTTVTTIHNSTDEIQESEAEKASSSASSDTENKLKSVERNLRINYSIVPLETLIGSFTLNERLQFINELFEGSSDAFSSAIKKLDVLDDLDSARNVVAQFAENNNWDLDSEIVEDFLVKICRRYA